MSTAMSRSELIVSLAEATPEIADTQVDEAVKILLDTLTETLACGERIEIRGFGSFSLHSYSPRLARNPKTGEKVEVGPRNIPRFKPGKELRNRVDQAWKK
jgi:integration host factor subunit beta